MRIRIRADERLRIKRAPCSPLAGVGHQRGRGVRGAHGPCREHHLPLQDLRDQRRRHEQRLRRNVHDAPELHRRRLLHELQPQRIEANFSEPSAVAVDPSGDIWVAGGHDQVLEFNSKHEYVRQFGKEGSGEGQFKGIGGIASDSSGDI